MKKLDNDTSPPAALKQQPFASASAVSALISKTKRNVKQRIPEVQKSMQLYLANRETEFILFRPVKNGVINTFVQVEEVLKAAKYSEEDCTLIACPSPEQVNVLICTVSLTTEQDSAAFARGGRKSSVAANQM